MEKEQTDRQIANDQFYKIIGERVKLYRKQSGITQDQLGEYLNISRVAVNTIEQGKQRLSVYHYARFCEIFNISLDALIPSENFDFKAEKFTPIAKESKLAKQIKSYRLSVINSGLTHQQLEGAELVFIGVFNIINPIKP